MANWDLIEFNTPQTQRLSDLAGVLEDLGATKIICDRFLSELSNDTPDGFLLKESLCAAALTRYGRSFASGVRRWDSQTVLDKLSAHLITDHEMFIELRNKWIAHSVNAFEENIVQVNLIPEERGPKGPAWVSVSHSRVVCLSSDHIQRLGQLSEAIAQHVQALVENEQASVLVFLKTLPVESLYARLASPSPQLPRQHYSKKRTSH
jgi:hypothetical protein